jgi:hypothetical protein
MTRKTARVLKLYSPSCANVAGESPCKAFRRLSPALDFDFIGTAPSLVPVIGPATVTFTRAGATATRVNPAGLIEVVAADTPRFDFDPVTLRSKGLLIEQARTNLLSYSVPDNTNWTAHTTDGTPNYGTAPDGTQSTYRTQSATPHRYRGGAVDVATYTYSIFVKAAPTDSIKIYVDGSIRAGGAFGSSQATFATPSSAPSLGGSLLPSSARCDLWGVIDGTNVYRVFLTFAPLSAGTANCFVYPSTANSQEWWGAQLEPGFGTSHIPSAGAPVTRNADVPTSDGIGSWINQNEGVFFAEFQKLPGAPIGLPFAINNAGTYGAGNGMLLRHGSTFVEFGGNGSGATASGATAEGINRACGAYRQSDTSQAVTVNGSAAVQNNTLDYTGGGTRLQFGALNSALAQPFSGHIRRFTYYNSRLSNADLETLSGKGVIDRANACHNTRRTCRDTANFVLTSKVYRFTGTDDEIESGTLTRPYITEISSAATELNFEEGLGRRSTTRVTLLDETDSDVQQDPYRLDRALPAAGTFWRNYKARNLHYANHPAEIETYIITDGVWGAPIVERFLIDSIDGPGKDGRVQVVLKDPTASLDNTMTPAPTTGKLAQPLGLNDLQAVLEVGDGEQYGTSGYFKHNDEVIRFTSRTGDTLSWPDGTYRAQFGTSAQAGKAGDALQLCHVGIDEAFATTVKRLFNSGGMDDSLLDLAGLASEVNAWLSHGYTTTYCIVTPTRTSELVKELFVLVGMASCWNPESQKQVFRVYAPRSPAELVPKILTGAGHLMFDTVQIETLDDKRLTRVTVRFDLARATANLREAKNYLTAEGAISLDAEGPNEYDDVRAEELFSRFFTLTNRPAMRTLAQRRASRYRDAPQDVEFRVDPKDGDLAEGAMVDLLTDKIVDVHGQPKLVRVIITKKHRSRRHGDYRARITSFGDRRYAFIAPNGTPDYPNHAGYACIAAATGLMSDGTDGFRIW